MSTNPQINGVIDTLLDISKRRHKIFLRLREAVKRGDKDAIVSLAFEYCNVGENKTNEKSH